MLVIWDLDALPRPGWAPDPPMVGIRSPDGLVVGLAPATLEFWVRFPNERNQGKQGATLCYSTGFLTGPIHGPEEQSRPHGGKSIDITDQPQYPRL